MKTLRDHGTAATSQVAAPRRWPAVPSSLSFHAVRRLLPLLSILPILPLLPLLLVPACESHPLTERCLYDGRSHGPGDTFTSTDGCNTCSCTPMGVVCTERACVPDGGAADTNHPSSDAALDTASSEDARSADTNAHAETGTADTGSPNDCSLDRTYRFWEDGGLRAYADRSTLKPARTQVVARDRFMNSLPVECSRELACTDAASVDLREIQLALSHADVVAALAMTTKPFYGTDQRPVDGTVLIFERDDQRGFTVGSGQVPPGVRALVDLLRTLQAETIASPDCANLPAY